MWRESHPPFAPAPLNSKAYKRFVTEHLLSKMLVPHMPRSADNACPQNCEYCYSKDKKGR